MNRVDRLREITAYEDIDLIQSYAGFLMPELEVVSARALKVTNA